METSYVAFSDRADAGRRLGARVAHLRDEDVVVLGLPRGGVPVALEVARALGAPLDVIVVRKLGVPFQPELGMGAIGEDGVRVINDEVVRLAGVSDEELSAIEARERAELERRVRRYRGDRRRLPLAGRTAVVVDDGIATGSTARAACQVARAAGARRVVLAVPVGPPGFEERVGEDADEVVCIATPDSFFAIGQYYEDFSQTPDDEVVACLAEADRRAQLAGAATAGASTEAPVAAGTGAGAGAHADPGRDEEVVVEAGAVRLGGHLTVPAGALGVVVFAHGSGSSRHSPRNRYVASTLEAAGLATLLFDLLTGDEEVDRRNVFDVDLLARRLVDVTRWVRDQPDLAGLPVGYFGASTGAAAALVAAAEPGANVAAVVSRGGRVDLATASLPSVKAPTLLVVGGRDEIVLDLNRDAQELLRYESRLVVVPGASHLFEEPGALQQVAGAARDWFSSHMAPARTPQPS